MLTDIRKRDGLCARRKAANLSEREPALFIVQPDLEVFVVRVAVVAHEEKV
jgi:hypothetical protein